MKIGLLGNSTQQNTLLALKEIACFLNKSGYETVTFVRPEDVDGVEVVLVAGGDGAILHAAVPAAKKGIKIIGINYGTIGFLTEYEKNEKESVAQLLDLLNEGKSRILKRTLLQLEGKGKCYYALNEFVLQRDSSSMANMQSTTQILKLEIQTEAGTDEISGDGLLFCTPTGSTAYSLSAGGAILTPEVPVFMMTPICAFSMRARPIVFADTEVFKIVVKKGKAVILSDGKLVATLEKGDEVLIKKAAFTANFPIKEGGDFFARVRNKLNG